MINGFLGNTMVASSQSSHLSNDELASVLSEGTLSVWSVNEIPVEHFCIKFESVDIGLLIYNQLLKHVGTFGVRIPIPLPRLFQGSHVSDLEHDMRPSRKPCAFDTDDIDGSIEGFFCSS
ncbi:envelope-like protein [Cucumis melo var. makuwa]|uniref:Envelope-like protein n=1 Tax=Cucumis melo var. makuwa TaxID=1194695 RepID=A0A5D3C8B0_CUCMM|nr:envelope-like protein [Cucumis melo var. makuwa]